MNKSPVNYLVTIALGVVLWILTAVFYGGSFSESLILAVSTPEDFLARFRIILGVAAFLGIVTCLYWYYYGNLNSVAGDLGKAKRVWWISFILQVILCGGLLFALVAMNLAEGIRVADWLIVIALLSLHTWFFYWICTFLMSPRPVKNIPLFR